MTTHTETRREEFERHAHECLDLVTHSTDPKIRATFVTMASTWVTLANEATPAIEHPKCPTCGVLMRLARVEYVPARGDRQHFECKVCGANAIVPPL
jgi:hypothetical protein